MNENQKSSARVVIVGSGFAGAATAWWLRRLGETDVLILERETAPGIQASAQNAAMTRQANLDLITSMLCAEGVRFLSFPPRDLQSMRPVYRRVGSALIGPRGRIQKLADILARVLPAGEFEIAGADRLSAIPYLSRIRTPSVLLTHSDGYIDLESLHRAYLANSTLRTSAAVRSARRESDRWILTTDGGDISCDRVVLAAGAWTGPLAKQLGATNVPLMPTKRHLFQSPRRPEYAADAPFVWDISSECYVRPDCAGGLFLSACDQDPYDPATPLLPDSRLIRELRDKLPRAFPSLAGVRFHRFWPGTRTLTPDGRFVVGPDPRAKGLFWAAGLGGHGVNCSSVIGKMAAESVLDINPPPPELSCFRFG